MRPNYVINVLDDFNAICNDLKIIVSLLAENHTFKNVHISQNIRTKILKSFISLLTLKELAC